MVRPGPSSNAARILRLTKTTNMQPTAPDRMQCMEVWGGNCAADKSFRMPGLDAWVYSQPYAQGSGGGDVYYISSCASGRITRILLADVSGHGEGISAVAVGLRDLMRRNVNFINQSRFVQEMNRQFADAAEQGDFATALVCSYFAPTRSFQVCRAGHPSPLVYRCENQEWMILEEADSQPGKIADTPLGVVDNADYSQKQISLNAGDVVLAFSDARIEAVDCGGQQLGSQGLMELVQTIGVDAPVAIIPQLLEKLRSYHHENLEQDDITAVLLQSTTERTSLKDNLLSPLRLLRKAADNTQLDVVVAERP